MHENQPGFSTEGRVGPLFQGRFQAAWVDKNEYLLHLSRYIHMNPVTAGLWRVPVWLALPTTGPLGQVGSLDVDAQTGEILFTQQILDEIAERGNGLAQRTPSPAK